MVRLLAQCLNWRWLLLAAIAAAVIAWFAETRASERALKARLAAIKAKGEPLTVAELVPTIPAGGTNAADSYDLAFGFLPGGIEQNLDRLLADQASARDFCESNEALLELVAEAGAADACAFPRDWSAPLYTLQFPEYAKMRTIARLLLVRSNLRAGQGRPDDALADLRMMYTVGRHAQSDPTMIGFLVGCAILSMAFDGLEAALAKSDPSPAACRRLLDELGRLDLEATFHRALLADRASGIELFDDIRTGRVSIADLLQTDTGAQPSARYRALFALHRSVGVLLLNRDEQGYLDRMEAMIKASALPWPQSHQELRKANALSSGGIVTALILPGLERSNWTLGRSIAQGAVARAALAVEGYRSQRGRYPSSLDEVKAAGWTIPHDPYGGGPLRYRRTNTTFAVWSVGPNMKDDNGAALDPKTMDTYAGPYDIALICDLGRARQKDAEHLKAWKEAELAAEQERLEAERRSRGAQPRRGGRPGDGRRPTPPGSGRR